MRTRLLKRVRNVLLGASPILLTPLDKACRKVLIRRNALRTGPIFIVGAPRTGSTLLYQAITQQWKVSYISNLWCLFHRTPLIGCLIARYAPAPRMTGASFESRHGLTSGLSGPSECGELWYRWFPRDRHFVDSGELSAETRKNMAGTLVAMLALCRAPLIVKNMNCGQRIRALSEIVPNAFFILCQRDPLYAAQSALEVRKERFGNTNSWWSIKPKEFIDLQMLSPEEQVVAQNYWLQRKTLADLEEKYPGRFTCINYEDFVAQPAAELERLGQSLTKCGFAVSRVESPPVLELKNRNRIYCDDATRAELEKYIEKYYSAEGEHGARRMADK